MSVKNSSDTIGNRTRDVPVCSAVPQPTAPPRHPVCIVLQLNAAKGLPFSEIMDFVCRHMTEYFGWGTGPSQYLYLHRLTQSQAYIPASSGIRTRDPSVHAVTVIVALNTKEYGTTLILRILCHTMNHLCKEASIYSLSRQLTTLCVATN
jgi:hypothetical protein